MKQYIFFIFIIISGILSAGLIAYANGGDQRVLDGKYLVNLSRSPFTWRSGIRSAMIISFLDVTKNLPITDDLTVTIRVAKLTAPGAEPKFIFEQKNIKARRGALEFPYTFAEQGFHEIYVDFAYASKPDMIYHMPDFLIEVQKPSEMALPQYPWLPPLAGLFIGFTLGFSLGKRK